jgi:hypothetical protein
MMLQLAKEKGKSIAAMRKAFRIFMSIPPSICILQG